MSQIAFAGRAPVATVARPHPQGRRIVLTWTNPPAAAFDGGGLIGIRIVRRERGYPLHPDDGVVVLAGGQVTDRFTDIGLEPLTRYYYTVFAFDGSQHFTGESSRANALATDDYRLPERLYRLLPAIHQREDLPVRPEQLSTLDPELAQALRRLPPELRGAGPLRRFLAAAAAPLGLMRSTAEGLRQLHDVDRVPPEYLPLLGGFVDWLTDRSLPLHSQRNEVRSATELYRTVGTVPSLRGIVTRYTGWRVRVAEYAQHLTRTNHPPQGNLFALRETAGGWRAADDAAELLGFGPGNTDSTGGTLVGSLPGPFALRPGMTLAVEVDGGGITVARFGPYDAANLTTATTAEVAATLARQLPDLSVQAGPDGRLRLERPAGQVRVEPGETSLVTLAGAPRGRLAVVPVTGSSFGVFYPVYDPLTPQRDRAARRAAAGQRPARPPVPGDPPRPAADGDPWLPAAPLARVHYQPFRGGSWGGSVEVATGGDPAAARLPAAGPGGAERVMLIWVEQPGTAGARLRYAVGTGRQPRPAVLVGRRGSPLPVADGDFLVVRDGSGAARAAQFAGTDFADPAAPSVTDVVNALNLRLAGTATASVAPGGAVRLESIAAGGDARLTVDLPHSTAARALGFEDGNHTATGDWGDQLDWGAPEELAAVPPGWLADLAAVDTPAGVLLCYARHDGAAWQVRAVEWDGAGWSGDEPLTTGPLSNREPALARDAGDRVWLAWTRQGALGGAGWSLRLRSRPAGGVWTAEEPLTANPGDQLAGDREPALSTPAGQPPRVFFRSDRGGGMDLWETTVGGAESLVRPGPAADSWPAPVTVGGTLWILHRSDRSVPLASAGSRPAEETGTLRRYAGSTSVVLSDLDRLGRLRDWDDLVSYTPDAPAGAPVAAPLRDDQLYTRGTVGLYLTQPVPDLLDESMAERLHTVLNRFLPVNVRAVVRLAPDADIESLNPPGEATAESSADELADTDQPGGS